MQTSIPRPHVLFSDGLPGSGESTAAKAVGGYLSHSRVFAETAQNHPLLVAAPDQTGAAFADIHEIHSADSFAAAAQCPRPKAHRRGVATHQNVTSCVLPNLNRMVLEPNT